MSESLRDLPRVVLIVAGGLLFLRLLEENPRAIEEIALRAAWYSLAILVAYIWWIGRE